MINANDWLEERVEAIFDGSFCRIMCPVIIAHLFWLTSRKRQVDPTPVQMRQFCLISWRLQLFRRRKRLLERLHSLPSKMALPPHIVASRQKTEPKRREKLERKKKMISGQIMGHRQPAESAWQRGMLFGNRHFLSDKRHQVVRSPTHPVVRAVLVSFDLIPGVFLP
jgi:hypothetical protein